MSLRPERIADYLKKEISNIIIQKVRDPRLKSIVINHISVTQDISVAKVFYSIYKDETELNEKILSKFSGMIRSEISKSMKIRRVPKIVFIFDKADLQIDLFFTLATKVKGPGQNLFAKSIALESLCISFRASFIFE